MRFVSFITSATAGLFLVASAALAQGHSCGTHADEHAAKTSVETATSAAAYPLDVCVVSGEKLPAKPVVKTIDGREVRFCCGGCVKAFEKNKEKYTKKLDDAVIAAQSATYPLEVCPVSGMKLGDMGEPYNYVYRNRLVRFCCSGCAAAFEKNPDKYLKMLDDAAAKKSTSATQSGS